MTEVFRTDASPIGNVQRTPQGGIRVDAKLTRTGVFVYRNPDGIVSRRLLAAHRADPLTG